MSRCSTWKLSLGLAISAIALTFASTTNLFAQSSDASVVVTVPAVGVAPVITTRVDESKLVALSSPAIPEGARDLGPALGETKMGMQLVLRRSQAQEEALKLLNKQSLNPSESIYAKTLTPKEFAATFGLAASDLEVLKSSLIDAGFTVGNVDNGRLTIDFEGTVAQVNAALHTDIHNFTGKDGDQHFAPAIQLQIPKALAPAISRIAGLQNFKIEERQSFNGPVVDFAGMSQMVAATGSGKAPTPVLTGEALHDASFTASKYVLGLKGSTTLNVRVGGSTHPVTGSLAIEDQNDKVVGFVADITKCEPYGSFGRSCTADYKPPVGSSFLKAVYSGDENERGVVIPATIISFVGSGTSSLVGSNLPITLFSTPTAAQSSTLTTVLSYYNVVGNPAPTGTITVPYDGSADTWAIATLPATAGGTSSGGGTSTLGHAYTYACSGNAVEQTFTCTMTMAAAYADANTFGGAGPAPLAPTYSGDTNYASSTTAIEPGLYVAAATSAYTPALSVSGGTTTQVYGTTSTVTPTTVTITCSGCNGGRLDGGRSSATAAQLYVYGSASSGAVANAGQVGTGAAYTLASDCISLTSCVFGGGAPWTSPADLAVGTYTIGYYYTGNVGTSGDTVGPAIGTYSYAVTKFTPTLSAVTAAPATVGVGSNTPVVLSDTFTIPLVGVLPSGAVTFTLNSVAYTATCAYTATAGSPTCSATVPGSTIQSLAGGNYTITSSFAGDNYYSAVTTGGTGTLSVKNSTTATMTSPTSATPVTQTYGALSAFTVTGQLAWTGSGTAPTKADVTFSVTGGTVGAATCSGTTTPYTCTATFTPTAADAVGSYNINLSFSGDTNYAASVSTQVGNYVVSKGTFTTIQMTTATYATPPTATTQTYGTTTAFSVYATLSPASGGVAPTPADVTFAVTGGSATGTFGATSCAVVSAVDRCTATFTPSGTAVPGSYNINVSFTGDSNYNAAGPSTNGTGLYVVSTATPILTLSPSPISSPYQSTIGIPVTVSVSPTGVTGTVNFTGTYATYGTLSATSCTLSAGSCSVTFTPNGTTAMGTYSNILTATLPASGDYNSATISDSLTITGATTTMAVTVSPASTFKNAQSATFGTVLSWVNPASQPTGTIKLTDTTNSNSFGTITLPTGTNSIAAGTACTTVGTAGTCTYSCTAANTTTLTFTCSVTNTLAGTGNSTGVGAAYVNTVTATYNADANFAAATGTTYLYVVSGYNIASDAGSIAVSGTAIATSTYGLTTAESPTATVTTKSNDDPSLTGSVFLDISGAGQLGTLYVNGLTGCSGSPCATVTSWNTPAVLSPSASPYSLIYTYSGNFEDAAGQTTVTTSTSTGVLTVNKQTPTLGGVTFAPASTEPYGTSQAITLSTSLAWLGVGEVPRGAVTFTFVNSGNTAITGSPFTATCGGRTGSGIGNSQTNSLTCTATVPAATIAALAVGTYTVTPKYTTDTNYGAATGTSGTFAIGKQTPTVAVTSVNPASVAYASGTPSTVTATLSWTGTGTAPTGSTLTFASTAAGAFSGESCSGATSPITCTVTFTPTTTNAVGTYTISASYAGDTNYTTASSAQTNNYSIGQAAITAIVLAADTPGTTTAGVTTVNLTATITPAIAGVTVTFNDTTTSASSTAVTNSSGKATKQITTSTTGVAGGLNAFSASVTATSSYSAAGPSNSVNVYFQGILFSTVGLHNFSGVITNYPGYPHVEGTTDGTKLGPYGVSIFNFTPAAVSLPLSFTNAASGAFSFANSCQGTIPANGQCSISFYYAPPFGDGCIPGGTPACTLDGAGYPQGTYESAPWSITLPSNTLSGIGDKGFDRSGLASPSGTVAGKAILVPGTLNVSPLTVAFGTVAQNSTSSQTVTVTNPNNASLSYTYTPPTGTNFTVTNKCVSPLAANATCQIFVALVTTAAGGPFSDSFSLTPTGGTAETVSLSGTVVTPGTGITLSTASHNFGNVTVGTTVTFAANITNTTAATVSLGLSNSLGLDYTTGTTCGTSLAAGASCSYTFSFDPSAAGSSTDTLTVSSTVPVTPGSGGNSGTVTVTGYGVAGGSLTASTIQHNWGTIAIGTQGGAYGVQLSNNTSSAVALGLGPMPGAGTTAGFTSNTNCPATLAVNASCEIIFNFTPTAAGQTTVVYPVSPSVTWNSGTYNGITLIGTGQ